MRRLLGPLFCVLVALVACASYFPVTRPSHPNTLPDGAVEFTTDIYSRWWAEVERCAQRQLPMRGVKFYVVFRESGGFLMAPDSDIEYAGFSFPDRPAVVMASQSVFDAQIVRHEFLHLIASPGHHNPYYFKKLCREIVSCRGECDTHSVQGADTVP